MNIYEQVKKLIVILIFVYKDLKEKINQIAHKKIQTYSRITKS